MAAREAGRPSCAIQRTFSRCPVPVPAPGRSSGSSGATVVVCREPLVLVSLSRYVKDLGFPLFFPGAVHAGDSLYDATLTDGDCRVRVTVDPSLNALVERNVLRCGCRLRNVSFAPGVCARDGAGGREDACGAYRVVGLEVAAGERDGTDAGASEVLCGVDVETLPWYGALPSTGPCALLPLRAHRGSYLPLWNNTDYCGAAWRDTPPSRPGTDMEEEEEEEEEELKATVTVGGLREAFFGPSRGSRGVARGGARGVARGVLLVRVLNKSRVVHYGKADANCDCPYKAVLEVCDASGSVCVVLWNSVCVDWYRSLRPGLILRLAQYRVKNRYQHRTRDSTEPDIELSLNSRNPTADISIVPESSVSPEHRPPSPSYTFYCGKELLDCPHGKLCDVIGLVVFAGRPERIRSKDVREAELFEYRWLLLEDGTTAQPITVQLYSTSQPETHSKIHPLSVVVATRMKVIRTPDSSYVHLTSTSFTQVYCTGSGHHSEMPYRKLRPVRQFVQWLQSLDDGQVLDRAVVGGSFSYPPPPVSLETYMRSKKGAPELLRGADFQREVKRLKYRERRSLCIQATVTMVAHCRRGEEQQCLVWTDRRTSSSSPARSPLSPLRTSSPTSSPSLNASLHLSPLRLPPSPLCLSPPGSSRPLPSSPGSSRPLPSSPGSSRPLPSSPCLSPRLSPCSPGSPVKLSPRLQVLTAGSIMGSGRSPKRRLFRPTEPPRKKRLPLNALPNDSDQDQDTGSLWNASMEFLEKSDEEDGDDDDEEDHDDDDDGQSFITAPTSPGSASSSGPDLLPRVAMETLPLQYCHARGEEQAVAVAMQPAEFRRVPAGGTLETFGPAHSYTGHYTLRLRALTDGVMVDAVFLPSPAGSPVCPPHTHPNTWTSILTHGGFSPHTPPPAPADLVAMASQLANQRLVCVLEACCLGGANVELILTRAYPLRD